ncbi:MAG: hypothetical protein WCR17_06030 [Candidatus Methanomethylophilaceae archaeon]|jgi:hypothetical protein
MISPKCIGCKYRHEGDKIWYDRYCPNPGKNIPCELWSRRGLTGYELELVTVYRMLCDGQSDGAVAYIERIFSQKGIPKGAIQ